MGFCSRKVQNTKQKAWDTRDYQFCFEECVREEGKWKCPIHGEQCFDATVGMTEATPVRMEGGVPFEDEHGRITS